MPIVGTAGHVDHGKSTLVRVLTGTDPDRWAEEKRRGLTIDLGFAWTQIGGHDVGFVDVPGHERFIKNMLAGVGALDCAIFVVAADGGWMPQTEEHAAVLDLLEVERGVIALTRVDLVDEETRDLAVLEILDEISGSALEGWPIVPVAAPSGIGIDEVRAAISAALDEARHDECGPFKMWVDRSFTIAGSGTVLTGTIVTGSVEIGDELEVAPGGGALRVRGLHHHGEPVERAVAGSRTAINVTGGDDPLDRGHLLVTGGTAMASRRFLVNLTATRAIGVIPDRGAFHLHVGTASRPATVRRMGDTDAFLVSVDEPVAAICGDRVILRDSGRKAVVGGGRILDPSPPRHPAAAAIAWLSAAVGGGPDACADAMVTAHGAMRTSDLVAATGGGTPSRGLRAGEMHLSESEVGRLEHLAGELTGEYHRSHPVRSGIPKSELASRLDVTPSLLEAVIGASSDLEEVTGAVRVRGFSNEMTPDAEQRWGEVRAMLETSFDVPRSSSLDIDAELTHFLIRKGDLVRIADDLVFTSSQIEEITLRVAELADGFTVSQFKDHFGMARRQAVPLLEWLDATGRTRRSGDGRSVRG